MAWNTLRILPDPDRKGAVHRLWRFEIQEKKWIRYFVSEINDTRHVFRAKLFKVYITVRGRKASASEARKRWLSEPTALISLVNGLNNQIQKQNM